MDFDKFFKGWRSAGDALDENVLTGVDSAAEFDFRRKSSLERLANRYRNFSIVAGMAAFWSVFAYWASNVHEGHGWPIWLMLCFEVYFVMAALMDYWLYMGIRSIDCATMPVETVFRKSMHYRKRHLQFMAVLIPAATALLVALGIYMRFDKMLIAGMIAGFVFGVAMGVRAFLRFMYDYRKILE